MRDDNGEIRELKPEDNLWYQVYVKHGPLDHRIAQKFRMRFRLPYDSFISLYEEINQHDMFFRWTTTDATGLKSSNLKLLLLGFLRYIGRGWTLDDVEESNGISREVNRIFLHPFFNYGSTVLYQKWITEPALNRNLCDQEKLFKMGGLMAV